MRNKSEEIGNIGIIVKKQFLYAWPVKDPLNIIAGQK